MKYIIIFLISFFLSHLTYSQTPGYLGKRIVLGVETEIKFSYFDLLDEEVNNIINPSLSISYVISKNKSLGLKFSHFNSIIFGRAYPIQIENNYNPDVKYNTNTFGLGIDYKIYKKDYIAPIGAYWQISVATYKTTSDDFFEGKPKELYINYYGLSSFNELNTTNIAYYLGVNRGKKFILYNSLGIDISIYGGLIFNKYDFKEGFVGDFFNLNMDRDSDQDYINRYYQLNTSDVIKKRLGLGLSLKLDLII